ncbi:MAG: hypothetical protein GX638_02630 [Crenarchaeota archaeon]|nr:hypothetical protein [Thermoproteota archaeon]
MPDEIILARNDLIEQQTSLINQTLANLGLPSEGIIADVGERQIINTNLPQYIMQLDPTIKRDARYLSKFVVGAGFGLFDYALNAIWNEVVGALKQKAVAYGLDIFFDAAVSGNLRSAYNTEDDLSGLKEIVLLDTCKKLELISEITYKKLAHILDMRNNIGISHPNDVQINAYELLGWLQNCVKDVLNDRPSEAAIQVKSFIDNLVGSDSAIDQRELDIISGKIASLSSRHCDHLIKSLFGIYCSTKTVVAVRTNIAKLAPIIWNSATEGIKYKLGIILEGYNNNLHKDKYQYGSQFFVTCDGNKYRSPSEKLITIEKLANDLYDKHTSWDNFFHEVPVIEELMSYIQTTEDIPEQIAQNLINKVVLCRIGRGVSYNNGVSPVGKPLYNRLLNLLSDKYAPHFIISLLKLEVQRRLEKSICLQQSKEMIEEVKKNVVNERLKECLESLIQNFKKDGSYVKTTDFKRLSSAYIRWN